MTKNELKALIEKKVRRQGTQGAISLAPILNEIIDLIPESTEGGGGVQVVEIEPPAIENIEDVIFPRGINFEIPAETAAILDKNPCSIISVKDGIQMNFIFFLPWRSDEWYRVMYSESNSSEVTSNIQTLKRNGKDMRMSIILRATDVVNFVGNEQPGSPLTRYLVSTTKAVYGEIHKTE